MADNNDLVKFIIIATLGFVILGSLIGTITASFIFPNQSGTAITGPANLTGATGVMAGLVPVVLVLSILLVFARSSGILGGKD